jgi:hypothetical protein
MTQDADTERMEETPRERLAWLMWCFQQGYVNAEDRAGMTNWLLEDPETLHPDNVKLRSLRLHPADVKLRSHLLAMADEVLTLIDGSWCEVCLVQGDHDTATHAAYRRACLAEQYDGEAGA